MTRSVTFAGHMTEADLLAAVIDLCSLFRLRVAHFRPARTEKGWRTPVAGDGKGFPDLVIAGPGGVAYRELKSQRGRLSPEQRRWLEALWAAGADAAVWRPSQWHSGQIQAELRGLAREEAA